MADIKWHENIISIQNWHKNDRQTTLILEYAHAGDVFNSVNHFKESNKHLHIKIILIQHYSHQTLNGMQYIHRLNYCHCDDFGIAGKYILSNDNNNKYIQIYKIIYLHL